MLFIKELFVEHLTLQTSDILTGLQVKIAGGVAIRMGVGFEIRMAESFHQNTHLWEKKGVAG